MSRLKLAAGDEYLAVDSGSTDQTVAIATKMGARVIIAEGKFNYSKSLNLGFQAARNPWVLVLSSHALPLVSDYMGKIRAAIKVLPLDVAVAYAPNTLDGQGPFTDDEVRVYREEERRLVYSYCGNGSALYRRSEWEAQPFDENIRTSEDQLWMAQAFARGKRIAFMPGARSINVSRYSLRYMFFKGHSDTRSVPHEPMSLWQLGLGLGALIKRYFRAGGKMPIGNLVRYCAHAVGRYVGSHQDYDNSP